MKDLIELRRADVPSVDVQTTQAGADHLDAWDLDQRVKAIHEAGHAVVARVLGIKVKAIDIKGRESGHIETSQGDDNLPSTLPDSEMLATITVGMAGGEAELAFFGQRTAGSEGDLRKATEMCYHRLNAGLDPNAPLFNLNGAPYDAKPPSVVSAFGDAVSQTLTERRAIAAEIVVEHKDQIEALATIVYSRRRLSDEVLEGVLDTVGLGSVA